MESTPQRHCPRCGAAVARRAEDCLACGAHLREQKRQRFHLTQGDLLVPLLVVAAAALVWLWKPWQAPEPKAAVLASATPSTTATPSATYVVAPTATPLRSPTPTPTPTLPPNTTVHIVESGETVITIAKLYGTTASAILKANGIKSTTPIHPGDELKIPLLVANTPTPTPTPTPSPTPVLYVVKRGDTLSGIARQFDTTVEALMQTNELTDATSIKAGSTLTIVKPPDFSATMAYETYEVQSGDTLSGIAARFKTTVAEIKQASGLKTDALKAGQRLKIPVGTATPLPTDTPEPTLTPSPTPQYRAPMLLGPPDSTRFEGADTVILLNWASVGILADDEWYLLHVQREEDSRRSPEVGYTHDEWTKVSSWRLPAEAYQAGLSEPQQFVWRVSVVRKTGENDDGTWVGEEISPRGTLRTFTWK